MTFLAHQDCIVVDHLGVEGGMAGYQAHEGSEVDVCDVLNQMLGTSIGAMLISGWLGEVGGDFKVSCLSRGLVCS